jgi:hypothetical protein
MDWSEMSRWVDESMSRWARKIDIQAGVRVQVFISFASWICQSGSIVPNYRWSQIRSQWCRKMDRYLHRRRTRKSETHSFQITSASLSESIYVYQHTFVRIGISVVDIHLFGFTKTGSNWSYSTGMIPVYINQLKEEILPYKDPGRQRWRWDWRNVWRWSTYRAERGILTRIKGSLEYRKLCFDCFVIMRNLGWPEYRWHTRCHSNQRLCKLWHQFPVNPYINSDSSRRIFSKLLLSWTNFSVSWNSEENMFW